MRIVGSCAALSPVLFSTASATFDYRNFLDDDIATYILLGIAVLYFTITAILLLLTVYCLCKKRRPTSEKQQQPHHDSHFQRAPAKLPLPSENSEPPADRASHRRVKRLKSDEEELIDGGSSSSEPSSPTDMVKDTITKLQQTPDPRRKKAAAHEGKQKKEQISHTATSGSSDHPRIPETTLPGAVSPLKKSPEMGQQMRDKDIKQKTILPPLQRTPIARRKKKDAGTDSLTTAATAAKPGEPGSSCCIPNHRLNFPQMQHRRKDALPPIEMSSTTKAACHSPQSASDELTSILSELDREFDSPRTSKRTHLDTSFAIENPGFEEAEKVRLLELQRQLNPVSQYWYEIGLQLGIPESTLDIKAEVHSKNDGNCMQEVCREWLKMESDLTWTKVVTVLKTKELVRHTQEVAEEIRKRFCQHLSPGTRSINSKISITSI